MRYLIIGHPADMPTLDAALRANGTLLSWQNAADALREFLTLGQYDLILTDGRLPAGLSLAELARNPRHAALALRATAPEPAQVADWLGHGVDMVLDARAPQDETAARLAALARRAHGAPQPDLALGPLRIDLQQRRAQVLGAALSLPPKTYEVLEYLALRPGQLISRDMLTTHVYGFEDEPDPRIFDVYICNLRAALDQIAESLQIDTIRGCGYRLTLLDPATDACAA
ncbi:MAG: winged-helix domain-containing protein [Pelagimonas sp.]|jgi:DNA-binding response OmpR family regulator|nr:winged-helix domain-containing protein [Pelagimonas sp.]